MICVYVMTHPGTGVFYIGSTSNLDGRRNTHLSRLSQNCHHSIKLQEAFNTDGQLTWQTTECATNEIAHTLEQQLISQAIGNPLLCNVRLNSGPPPGALNKDAVQRMSEVRTGIPKTAEWIDKIADSRRIGVVVDGIAYRSASEAAIAHNTSAQTVFNRIKNTDPKFSNWNYASA